MTVTDQGRTADVPAERAPLVVGPRQRPRPLSVVGEGVSVLASGEQTGSYEIFHQEGAEGSGPPPHHHPWDEAFYVIRGEVVFGIDGVTSTAVAGTLVHLPAGTIHWFRFGEGGAEMISITSREAASRFFADIDREVSGESPDFGTVMRIAATYKLVVLPPG